MYDVLDDRFRIVAAGDQQLKVLYAGCRWAEGPVYVPAGRYLLWSDIPNDRLLRWDETNGVVSTFRSPAGYVNGNTLDWQGRFTDPDFGIISDYEGHRADREIGACNVYHVDTANSMVSVVAEGLRGPNGIIFSSDERRSTSTTSASMTKDGCGSQPAMTGCTATHQTEPSSAASEYPK